VRTFPALRSTRIAWKPETHLLCSLGRQGAIHFNDANTGDLWRLETEIANCWEFCWAGPENQFLLSLASDRLFRINAAANLKTIVGLAMRDVPFWEGAPIAARGNRFVVRSGQAGCLEIHSLHDKNWTVLTSGDVLGGPRTGLLPGVNNPFIAEASLAGVDAITQTAQRVPVVEDRPPFRFLILASEWDSKHGGLSTFNRSLCMALAAGGVPVVCAVPSAADSEIEEARVAGVILVRCPFQIGADEMSRLHRPLDLPPNFAPTVVVGHGRVTGPAAAIQVRERYPNAVRVHFVHTAPGQTEFAKGRPDASAVAEERERIELGLASTAQLVVGVGPRLTREIGNILASVPTPPPICRIDPGIELGFKRKPPPGLHCLVLGRAEDRRLKGLDIAARAMGRVVSSRTRFSSTPELIVRGEPLKGGDELLRYLKKVAKADLEIRIREYTSDAGTIQQDLRRATVLLMPSRTEGFGLVALEALGQGTPILVSNKSGVGELLESELSAAHASNLVIPTPDDPEKAAREWETAIQLVLSNPEAAFERAAEVTTLLASRLTWRSSAERLLEQIGKIQASPTIKPTT